MLVAWSEAVEQCHTAQTTFGPSLNVSICTRCVIVQVDVTEVFRQIPRQKVIRIVKLVIYLIAFVYFIFR